MGALSWRIERGRAGEVDLAGLRDGRLSFEFMDRCAYESGFLYSSADS
jgi:hypothetical protein